MSDIISTTEEMQKIVDGLIINETLGFTRRLIDVGIDNHWDKNHEKCREGLRTLMTAYVRMGLVIGFQNGYEQGVKATQEALDLISAELPDDVTNMSEEDAQKALKAASDRAQEKFKAEKPKSYTTEELIKKVMESYKKS